MRIPAVSFDPVVGPPVGVGSLQAMTAAKGTSVSPDGRSSMPMPQPRRPEPEAEEAAATAESAAEPAEPLPASYPPLAAQRCVLDRPAPAPPPVAPPRAEEAERPRSSLDETLLRVMGAARD